MDVGSDAVWMKFTRLPTVSSGRVCSVAEKCIRPSGSCISSSRYDSVTVIYVELLTTKALINSRISNSMPKVFLIL